MARDITITFDDGTQHVYKGAPDDVTPEQVTERARKEFGKTVAALDGGRKPQMERTLGNYARAAIDGFTQQTKDLLLGGLRGAGSIGATLLAPQDALQDAIVRAKGGTPAPNTRRQDMTDATRELGANPDSLTYGLGKLGTEIAGTAGVPGAAASVLKGPLAQAVATGGFRTGANPVTLGQKAVDLGTRAVGGGAAGYLSAGLVDPEQANTGGMVGLALPPAVKALGGTGRMIGNAGKSAAKAVFGDVAPDVAALAKKAKTYGIDVPADRLLNSKPLDAVSSGLNYVPFSGRAATESKMAEQLNRAASRLVGQDTPNMMQALRKADDVLGGQFDDFLRSNKVRFDKQFLDDMAEAANQANKELGQDGARIINAQIDEIIAKAKTGEIDGQAAYNIKKTLDRIGRRNSPEAWYALDLKKRLMDALNRSVGQEKAKGFATLRQQYGNMIELQKLAKNGVDGEISVARLANMKNINNEPLQDLADIAAQFVRPREAPHGSMQRAVVALGTGSVAGLPGLTGAIAGGRATNSLLNSKALTDSMIGMPRRPSALTQMLSQPEAQGLLYRSFPVLMADQ